MQIDSTDSAIKIAGPELGHNERMRAEQYAAAYNQGLKNQKLGSKAMLAQEDFLNLLTQQLKYQDPLSPMDNKEWVAQMASFTSLQTNTEMSKKMDTVAHGITQLGTYAMVGRNVEYFNPIMNSFHSGRVDAVSVDSNGIPELEVGGTLVGLDSVTKVQAK